MDREREVETRRVEESPGAVRHEEERVVRTDRDETIRRDPNAGLAAARDRFGGIDIPASLIGMLTALAMLVILGGLVGGAISAFGYQTGLEGADVEEVTIGGMIAGLVVLFLSFVIGGWAAGRMARYDGLRNGIMTAIWAIILFAVLSIVGAWLGDEYDVLAKANLPRWFSEDVLTSTALIGALIAAATAIIGGALGGLWGAAYHRRADREILAPRAT